MKFRRSNIRLCFFILFMMLYLCVGAFLFSLLESPVEEALTEQVMKDRRDFIDAHTCISDADLEAFIVEIIEANNRGVSAARNVTSEPNWSFGQSLFFAGTILTTIGYGHVTPLSEGGKVFSIVYATIGIPLTLIMFTALVERLMILTTRLLVYLQERLGHLYKSLHIRMIHLSILLVLLVIFIFLIPAAIFTVLESSWNFLDSFYYCFISLTTIGLGDYIPGDDPQQAQRPLYKICTTFYLFIGLVFMMLTLANVYDIPELNLGYHFYMRSDEEEAERTRLRDPDVVSTGSGSRYNTTTTTEQVNKGYQGSVADDTQALTDS